ncbi:MAG: RDD family protein [Candidatus Kapabacteria bacterium]|nr:RDD family protein [Ignavibacteriota bacterium]MCW5884485.1 RDD family protein [Candidatus Kapabacteria bacterium]
MANEMNTRNFADFVPDYSEPDPYEYRVGFLRRLAAYIIDYVLISLLITIAIFATGQADELMDASMNIWKTFNKQELMDVALGVVPIAGVITLLYFSSELFLGASLGKLLLSIRIGSDDRYPAPFTKLFARYILKNIGVVFALIGSAVSILVIDLAGDFLQFVIYIGFLFTIGRRSQGFHDMLSATAVYYTNELIDNNNINQE